MKWHSWALDFSPTNQSLFVFHEDVNVLQDRVLRLGKNNMREYSLHRKQPLLRRRKRSSVHFEWWKRAFMWKSQLPAWTDLHFGREWTLLRRADSSEMRRFALSRRFHLWGAVKWWLLYTAWRRQWLYCGQLPSWVTLHWVGEWTEVHS